MDLVGEFVRDILSITRNKKSVTGNQQSKRRNVPSHLLKHATSTIGDLLVCAAHLDGVDFSLAELRLGEVEGY